METAISWLNDIIRAILSIVPHLVIIRSTHAGVRFSRGKHVSLSRPGVTLYWPLVTEMELVPTTMQVLDLPGQYLVTSDEVVLAVDGYIEYVVKRPIRAVQSVTDYQDAIRVAALSSVKSVIGSNTFSDLTSDPDRIDREIQSGIRLNWAGIEVLSFSLSNLSPCIVLANWSG